LSAGGGVAIDAPTGWSQGWKVTHTQGGTTTDLQLSTAPSKVTVAHSTGVNTLYVDRWGMLSESSGGAPAMGIDILLRPDGKSTTDSSALRLCIVSGGRIAQVKHGAACP
jgi:type IV fimbrial biogenesis protein FimT